MKTLTIRQVPDELHEALRLLAARAGRSMEEEVRQLLARAAAPRREPARVAGELHALVRKAHGGAMPGGVVDDFLDERRRAAQREEGE